MELYPAQSTEKKIEKKLHDLRLLGDKKTVNKSKKKSFNERWRVSIGRIDSHCY